MRRRGWIVFALILLVAVFVFPAFEDVFSPEFHACIAGAKNPYNSTPSEQNPPAFKPKSATAVIECTGGFINTYGSAFNALGTLVIAAFTATLWIATRRQADLTRQALIADKGAFVHACGINYYWTKDPKGHFTWVFRVAMKNTGSTPTKNFRVYCACEIRNSAYPAGHTTQSIDDDVVRGIIAPNEVVTGPQVPKYPIPQITVQDILDVQAGNKYIYVWGWIKYFDVFPGTNEHTTRFRWGLTFVGDPKKFNPMAQAPAVGSLVVGYVHTIEGNSAEDE